MPVDEAELRRLFEQGLTYREMAERLGVSVSAVKYRLRRMGLRRTPRVTEEKLRRLRELYLAGVPYREIARELGISRLTVHKWVRRLGLPPRGRGWRPGRPSRTVEAVRRALAEAGVATLSDLCRLTGLHSSTVLRALRSMPDVAAVRLRMGGHSRSRYTKSYVADGLPTSRTWYVLNWEKFYELLLSHVPVEEVMLGNSVLRRVITARLKRSGVPDERIREFWLYALREPAAREPVGGRGYVVRVERLDTDLTLTLRFSDLSELLRAVRFLLAGSGSPPIRVCVEGVRG